MDAAPEDHRLAAELAAEAGDLLQSVRGEMVARDVDPAELRAEGDRRSHQLLMERLATERPQDAVLSEEGSDDRERLGHRRVWIVDPLDGTREFSEPPRTDWAVHVALAIDGVPAAGAVALPAQETVLSTASPRALPDVSPERPPRLVVSRTRPPAAATFLADALEGELIEMGSAGAKAMAILLGAVDVYAHSGGQYEWDSCAPVAVALAAGAHASRIDGTKLSYNSEDPYLPDLLICRPELAAPALEALAAFSG